MSGGRSETRRWTGRRRHRLPRIGQVLIGAFLVAVAAPATAAGAAPSSAARSGAAWSDVAGKPAATRNGARPQVRPQRLRALRLDRSALAGVLDGAPRERARAARTAALTISLPAPDGRMRRFAVQESSVMEPALAAEHPEIATYSGTGIDDAGATVHLDLTPLGFHASVRGPGGSWYIDPYYHRDQSLYVSYRRADLVEDPHGRFFEREVPRAGSGLRERAGRAPRAGAAVALRTYRLALVSDPSYATYHGATNVTAAKVTLVDRVNQIYEADLAIHLTLVANNDVLNLDTDALMTGANGPCGAAACYTTAQAEGCDVPTLNQTRIVLGQLIGASNYDVGHIGMGINSGGIAYLGVAGDFLKGGGCTGVSTPVGDLFAVDYAAHELGHQFAANHTFNGTDGSCANNIADTSVEPGSGITVMAYAGICGLDNLQPHSDPYFSQRSIDEVANYVGRSARAIDEVQTVSLREFAPTDSFRLTYDGAQSAQITRGTNYDAPAIKAAIESIAGFPAGATVTVLNWDGSSSTLDDTGFSATFGGSLANTDVAPLSVTSPAGTTGFVGETDKGGVVGNGGAVAVLANRAPEVDAAAAFTIPTRTPFRLTGTATDADGNALVYLWEQNDAGSGTSLVSNTKTNGPLFGVFGTAAAVTPEGTLLSPSPGENAAGTSPTRVFPDLAQVVAGNTNAATGSCPAPPLTPAAVDCYSEFLPTSAYANTLSFRLTARDSQAGGGAVAHDDTILTLAKSTGPFRVTSQAAATSAEAGTPVTVTWAVAGTNAPPVNAANVRITQSSDGGQTFPAVVHPSTPNDGSQVVRLANANTAQARIKVEAVGNVFFDVNHADFTILPGAPVVTNDGAAAGVIAQYSDAPADTVTISATDENSPGSALTATATGLPAGLTLATGAPSPGSRTWTVGGTVTAPPGTHQVEVAVDDGTDHVGITFFDIVVLAEDALATYTGDTVLTGAPGAAQAPAKLSVTVLDGSAAPASTDPMAGDIANATVTFKEGATTLCAAVPVVTAGSATTGTATCTADLSTAATHHVDAVIGGRYAGSAAGDVEVRRTDPPPPSQPWPAPAPAPVAPVPPPAPSVAVLAPNLASVARRLRLSRTGRVSIKLRCRTIGTGAAAATCTGNLKLTARINGRRQTIGTATFRFTRTASKTVSVRLSAKARRALKKVTSSTLTVAVTNAGRAPRTATKNVGLVPRRR